MKEFEHNHASAPLGDGIDTRDSDARVVCVAPSFVNAKTPDSNPTTPNSKAPAKEKILKIEHRSPNAYIDNRSFLQLLILAFVSFMLISVVCMVLIFYLSAWASKKDVIHLDSPSFTDYKDMLERGEFNTIPVSRVCGDDGWLCIVDANGNFVYSSDGLTRSYTPSELGFIQDYASGKKVSARSIRAENGEYHHLISVSSGDGTEQFLFLDTNLQVISGSIPIEADRLTKREFDFFTFNDRNDGRIIEKYPFTWGEKDFYAVYYDTNNNEGVTPYLFAIIAATAIVFLLVASLILYIRYINKHVQRPLKALNKAMSEFSTDNYRARLEYNGSKEFEQLVDSYNEMVTLLGTSEAQRSALEEDRQRMLAGLSHDLKTPITIIQGFSKAIRDGLVGEEDKQKYLNLIINKSENMGELINKFYEFSKLDHPDFKLSLEEVDVAELTRSYLASRYDEFEFMGYSLEADIPEERLVLNADKSQLIRVFENLTGNFLKYTPKGSTLYLRVNSDGENVTITFADNGNGIPQDIGDSIFAPFVVGEQSRNKQGTGLGLAICKKIIDAHGGTITLNPSPLEGYNTEFDIILKHCGAHPQPRQDNQA